MAEQIAIADAEEQFALNLSIQKCFITPGETVHLLETVADNSLFNKGFSIRHHLEAEECKCITMHSGYASAYAS